MKLYGLPRKKIAALFDVNVTAISKHLQNIYKEGKLQKEVTVSKMEVVQKEGNRNTTCTIEIDTDKYLITGVPFYNYTNENQFKATLEKILSE